MECSRACRIRQIKSRPSHFITTTSSGIDARNGNTSTLHPDDSQESSLFGVHMISMKPTTAQ